MNIVVQVHNASVPEAVQRKADLTVRKLAARLRRAVDATVRFVADGPTCRAEITLRAPGRRMLVAEGSGRLFEVALAGAVARLEAHVAHQRSARDRRLRAAARARADARDGTRGDARTAAADLALDAAGGEAGPEMLRA